MIKIIDCFIFYNELDLLTYRLNILNNIVDYFVIIESTHSFIGKQKDLFFNDNKHMFEKFNDKIIHIVVDDLPYKYPNINYSNGEQWKNEFFQRNAISIGLLGIDIEKQDVITITDLDEIPDPNILASIKKGNIIVDINALEIDVYYYNLNAKFHTKWTLGKILTFKKYKDLNMVISDIRNINCSVIKNSGWHLSYFGDANFIKNKIENFSHQEFNNYKYTELSKIEERVKTFSDLYDRNSDIEKINIKDNNYLPIEYENYLRRYFIIE